MYFNLSHSKTVIRKTIITISIAAVTPNPIKINKTPTHYNILFQQNAWAEGTRRKWWGQLLDHSLCQSICAWKWKVPRGPWRQVCRRCWWGRHLCRQIHYTPQSLQSECVRCPPAAGWKAWCLGGWSSGSALEKRKHQYKKWKKGKNNQNIFI